MLVSAGGKQLQNFCQAAAIETGGGNETRNGRRADFGVGITQHGLDDRSHLFPRQEGRVCDALRPCREGGQVKMPLAFVLPQRLGQQRDQFRGKRPSRSRQDNAADFIHRLALFARQPPKPPLRPAE